MEEIVPVFSGFLITIGLFQLFLILGTVYQGIKVRQEAGDLLMPVVPLRFGKRPPSYWPLVAVGFLAALALMRGNLTIAIFLASALLGWLPLVVWVRCKRGAVSLELRVEGIILGGVRLIDWSSVKRFSWCGAGPIQLRLYILNYIVDLPVRAEDQQSIDGVFTEQFGARRDNQLECLEHQKTPSSL